MQHNIKDHEVLVPYTAEENAELSGGEDTVPPPLPPRRPLRAAAPESRTRRRGRSARPKRKRKGAPR